MKELSIEEKVKRYDEALARANEMIKAMTNIGGVAKVDDIQHLFPELKESEDERIRKKLIEAVKGDMVVGGTKDKQLAISWLEKQGEQRPIIVPKFMVGDFIKLKDSDETYEVSKIEIFDTDEIYYHLTNGGCVGENADNFELVEQKPQGKPALEAAKEEKVYNQNCVKPADKVEPKFRIGDIIKDTEFGQVFTIRTITKDKYIYTDDSFDWIKDQDEYELVEQKPADKVEPKFREGEWVVSPNGVYWHIDKISNNRYEVTSNIGESSNWPLDTNIYHSFSIQDAKDSDVLAVEPIEDYQYPFVAIYKEHGLDFFNSYCFIGFDGKFYEADTGHSTEKIHPATKEQRDQLKKAMTDAGYTFDFEKKELKKIEQKPVEWSEEDENMLKMVIKSCEQCGNEYAYYWLKTLKDRVLPQPKQEWSEEDEEMLENIICDINTARQYVYVKSKCDEETDWLKSLKDRVHPKKEWSKEDEGILACIIGHLSTCLNEEAYKKYKSWLKSLKNRCIPLPKQEWGEEDEKYLIYNIEQDYRDKLNNNPPESLRPYYNKVISWLKFLRPQKQWKPSDKQLEALEHAINCYSGISPTNTEEVYTLEIMKEQLKKLREG